jgi:hypothetical protein
VNQWMTILSLLKLGIAWEAIWEFTDEEVIYVLSVNAAMIQKQNDDQAQHDRAAAARR